MSITHITSTTQLNSLLSRSKEKVTVIDFHASWCGPCHQIAPTFEALSKQHRNVNFLKCDVDAAKDVASMYRVTAMPTFIFLKGDRELERVKGANRTQLEATVRKYTSGSSGSAFAGKGQTLGGSSPAAPQPEGPGILAAFNKVDPQVRMLLYLLVAYLVFLYVS